MLKSGDFGLQGLETVMVGREVVDLEDSLGARGALERTEPVSQVGQVVLFRHHVQTTGVFTDDLFIVALFLVSEHFHEPLNFPTPIFIVFTPQAQFPEHLDMLPIGSD